MSISQLNLEFYHPLFPFPILNRMSVAWYKKRSLNVYCFSINFKQHSRHKRFGFPILMKYFSKLCTLTLTLEIKLFRHKALRILGMRLDIYIRHLGQLNVFHLNSYIIPTVLTFWLSLFFICWWEYDDESGRSFLIEITRLGNARCVLRWKLINKVEAES